MAGRNRWLSGAIAANLLIFGWLAWGVVGQWSPMAGLDQRLAQRFSAVAAASELWLASWTVIAAVFHPTVFIVVELIGALVIAVRTRLGTGPARRAVALLLLAAAGGLLSSLVKVIVARPRPPGAAVEVAGFSFPSGHAFGAAVAVAIAVVFSWPHLATAIRPWVCLAAALLAGLVAFDRLALDVHYLSDVLAGLALGAAWALAAAVVTGHPAPNHPAPISEAATV